MNEVKKLMPSGSIEGASKEDQVPGLSQDKRAHVSSALSWDAEAGGGDPGGT